MDNCYIISYDIAKEGNYDAFYHAIKDYGIYAPITESTWAIVTEDDAKKIRDTLGQYLPQGSRLFVVRSGVESAWWNVRIPNEWLKRNL